MNAIVEAGGIAYLGGEFTKMSPGRGRQHDPRTTWPPSTAPPASSPSWNPKANGKVWALELSADGNSVYVGGDFSYIGGKLRLQAGQGRPRHREGRHQVQARRSRAGSGRLALDGDRLYVGGEFLSVGGQPRPKLAAVDARHRRPLRPGCRRSLGRGRYLGHTGIPTPDYDAGHVFAVDVIGGTVFAGGTFTNFGCQGGLVTLDAVTGGLVEAAVRPRRPIFDLDTSATPSTPSAEAPAGGPIRLRPRQEEAAVEAKFDGDTMGVAVSASTVYVAGHYDYVVSRTPAATSSAPAGRGRHHLLAFNHVRRQAPAWNPDADTSTGPYAAAVGDNALYVGGEFKKINFKAQPGFTVFPGTP